MKKGLEMSDFDESDGPGLVTALPDLMGGVSSSLAMSIEELRRCCTRK